MPPRPAFLGRKRRIDRSPPTSANHNTGKLQPQQARQPGKKHSGRNQGPHCDHASQNGTTRSFEGQKRHQQLTGADSQGGHRARHGAMDAPGTIGRPGLKDVAVSGCSVPKPGAAAPEGHSAKRDQQESQTGRDGQDDRPLRSVERPHEKRAGKCIGRSGVKGGRDGPAGNPGTDRLSAKMRA